MLNRRSRKPSADSRTRNSRIRSNAHYRSLIHKDELVAAKQHAYQRGPTSDFGLRQWNAVDAETAREGEISRRNDSLVFLCFRLAREHITGNLFTQELIIDRWVA